MVHDVSEGKTFVRCRRLGRKGVEETRDISADLWGPSRWPEMVNHQPWENPKLV